MLRLMLAMAMAGACCGGANAFQNFEEYRILGSEIQSVSMAPYEHEDPATLIIKVGSSADDAQEIVIESDGDLDTCKSDIETIIGNSDQYAQIVIYKSAQTMNGVLVTECAMLDVLRSYQ